jgi:hypothetical protein
MARRDYGFSSLTQNWEGKLIAVIVSGYDGDGAEALCGIKEVGGITIEQRLDTARQPDMPESAIQSGCIDFVLSPEDIAQEIVRIAHGNQGRSEGLPNRRTRGPLGSAEGGDNETDSIGSAPAQKMAWSDGMVGPERFG